MKKRTILIITIPAIFLLYLIGSLFLQGLDWQYREWKLESYAKKFCPNWENYKPEIMNRTLSYNESKALGLFSLMKYNIIEENQASSYEYCCDYVGLDCVLNQCENYNETIPCLFVLVGNESFEDWRYLDYQSNNTETLFLNYRFNKTSGGYERI